MSRRLADTSGPARSHPALAGLLLALQCSGAISPAAGAATPLVTSPPQVRPAPGPALRSLSFNGYVVAVFNGESLRVRLMRPVRRYVTVRLVGIDAPMLRGRGRPGECGGLQARRNLRRWAPAGRRIWLRTDPTQGVYDPGRRLLAYAQVPGVSLQRVQLGSGWTRVDTSIPPFGRLGSYQALEASARARAAGAWYFCAGNFLRTG